MYRYTTGRFTENSNIIGITTKCGDIIPYPFENCDLIHVGIAAFRFFGMFFTQSRESKMTEAPQPVIESYQDYSLTGKLFSPRGRVGSASPTKAPPCTHTITGSFASCPAPAG